MWKVPMRLLRLFSVRARMVGAIVLVLAIVSAIGIAALVGIKQGERLGIRFIENEFVVASMLGDVREGMSHLRRHEKDLILNLQNAKQVLHYKTQWDQANRMTDTGLRELERRLQAVDQQAIAEVRGHLNEYRKRFASVYRQIDDGFSGSAESAAALMQRTDSSFEAAETALAGLSQRVQQHGARAADNFEQNSKRIAAWLVLAIVLAAILVVPLTLLNMQSICAPLDDGVAFARAVARGELDHVIQASGRDELAALVRELETMRCGLHAIVSQVGASAHGIRIASDEVSQGSGEMNQRVERDAQALSQTASSTQSLAGTVRHNADTAEEANAFAGAVLELVRQGDAVVGQVIATMGAISQSASRIVDIVSVIDGVAFQTNILALNAAVEAARAGEQGRGFAVVATEVRALAGRSASAAREIASLATTSLQQVHAGTGLADEAGAAMNKILGGVEQVSRLVSQIASAGSTQSEGIAQINAAIALLEESARRNALLIERTAEAARHMQMQVEDMEGTISVFKTDGGPLRGSKSAGGNAPLLAYAD